jgi:ribosomal protein S27AE
MANPRRVQCGAPDCKRQYNSERQRDFQRQHKAEHGAYYSWQFDQARTKKHRVTCAKCGEQVMMAKPNRRYCSHACWYEANRKIRKYEIELYRPKRRVLRVQIIHVVRCTRRRWYSTCCPICGGWFLTSNSGQLTCSRKCGKRASRDRRRALERQAFVSHVNRSQVYERDQWTCRLCGEAVLPDEVVPHPQAPTLDHIIALSQGGTHEESNVQLAHFYCNTIKNDGDWSEDDRASIAWS